MNPHIAPDPATAHRSPGMPARSAVDVVSGNPAGDSKPTPLRGAPGRHTRCYTAIRRGVALLALLLPLFAAASAIEPLPFTSDTERDRFRSLVEELRCTVCQNQSLADSDAPLARDLRREVFSQIRAGRSDTEIRGFLVDRYGEFILYNPPLAAHTLVLWAGPVVLLGIGLLVALITVKRRRQRLDAE